MSSSNNTIISHTSIYMLGDILRRGVSLIMLPIYTRYLTPEDYGIVELLSMTIDFASIIFGARVGQAVFRLYCTAPSSCEKKGIISSALLLSAILNGIGAITIYLLADSLALAIFSDITYSKFIALFAITLLLEPFLEIPLTFIRAQQKPWLFFIFSIAKLILQLSLNIYFVVMLELHVEGVIYSAVISSIVMSVLLLGYSLPQVGLTAKKSICKNLFSFSLPLKLATFGSFYMAFGDRYILNIYTDLSQVGIYSLGYKFGFIFLLLTWDPFQKMWDSEKYNIYEKPDAKAIYQKVFLYISLTLILVGLSISILTKDLLRIMADPSFLNAYKIVPIIVVAYAIQAWTNYCSFGILISKKTMHIAYAEMIGVATITVAYFTLIPLYGIYGAAWATTIGFVVRFYWTNLKAKQYYDMELPWGKVWLTFLLAAVIFALSFLTPDEIIPSIFLRITLIFLFIVTFLSLPILTSQDKTMLANKLLSLKKLLP